MKAHDKQLARMINAGEELADALDQLTFAPPVAVIYNALRYAREGYLAYLEKFATGKKRIVLVGMNPGPWGMAQTGVPFGEVSAVRDWMGICATIHKPEAEHPKRPVEGFECKRSEVSGRRLWGLFAERFKTASAFFEHHFVVNYCPLMFMEESGRNLTPDKLSALEKISLQTLCDRHLNAIIKALGPEWVIGVGVYAENRVREALGEGPRYGRIMHPSPASPQANSGWAEKVTAQLEAMEAW